jgi:hypothetical protein
MNRYEGFFTIAASDGNITELMDRMKTNDKYERIIFVDNIGTAYVARDISIVGMETDIHISSNDILEYE